MNKVLLAAAAAGLVSCGCIAAGSGVLTPRGRRRIESLKAGDEVISIDPSTGERVTTVVVATRVVKRETLLLSGDGWALRCTSDHPLYDPSTREWAPAGDWVLGKRSALLLVADEPSAPHAVQVAERTLDGVLCELIDLSVAHELHNFVAEGVLVHNKKPIGHACANLDGGTNQPRKGNACACPDGSSGVIFCDPGGAPTCSLCPATDAGP